jgi:hypothetical protein
MKTARRSLTTLCLILYSVSIVFAQQESSLGQSPVPIVTATASNERVRYLAAGEVQQTRLQVFSSDGAGVFDSSFRLGNLIDWRLMDAQGAPLPDGAYLFLVTVKEFSGRLVQKYGTATLDGGEVYLEHGDTDALSQAQTAALEANRQSDTFSPVDRVGVAAGLTRTPAAATGGATAAGTAGSGPTGSPEAGAVTTENVTGTGTAGRLAKWTDGAGTLWDSVVTESGGNLGLGTATPQGKLHIQTNIGEKALQLFSNGSSSFGRLTSEVTN